MSVSRRGFLRGSRSGTASHAREWLAARGHEELVAELQQGRQGGRGMARPQLPPGVEPIRISSNENPLGPGKAAIDAILGKFPEANRYPFNSTPLDADLEILIAKLNSAKRENVVLGVGSQELLKNAVRVFMSPTKHLVEPSPTFASCNGMARQLGWTVKTAPLDAKLRADLSALLPHVKGAGLVYLCNPQNPAATINSAKEISDFVAEVCKTSPTTAILIDEAYCDYATDPSFQTAIPLALATPNVIVARTFSKAYGMAGLRQGYAIAHPDTIRKMRPFTSASGTGSLNVFGMAAATMALQQDSDGAFSANERKRNQAVRDFSMKWFADRGMKPTDCQANFMFVNIGSPAKAFREACRAKGVMVARDFPPFEKTMARISLGTMEEMQKAVNVFGEVLGKKSTAAA